MRKISKNKTRNVKEKYKGSSKYSHDWTYDEYAKKDKPNMRRMNRRVEKMNLLKDIKDDLSLMGEVFE